LQLLKRCFVRLGLVKQAAAVREEIVQGDGAHP